MARSATELSDRAPTNEVLEKDQILPFPSDPTPVSPSPLRVVLRLLSLSLYLTPWPRVGPRLTYPDGWTGFGDVGRGRGAFVRVFRSEEHTSELQ